MTDIDKMRAGDKSAFKAVLEKYGAAVEAVVSELVSGEPDWVDVATFVWKASAVARRGVDAKRWLVARATAHVGKPSIDVPPRSPHVDVAQLALLAANVSAGLADDVDARLLAQMTETDAELAQAAERIAAAVAHALAVPDGPARSVLERWEQIEPLLK